MAQVLEKDHGDAQINPQEPEPSAQPQPVARFLRVGGDGG